MLVRWQHLLLSALGVLALLVVLGNALLFTLNQKAQEELQQRQQFIQQTVPIEALYRDIVKTLAEMAVKGNDKQLLDMLAAQGLTLTADSPAATPGQAQPRRNQK
jgi:uncharacterized membrane protein YeiB